MNKEKAKCSRLIFRGERREKTKPNGVTAVDQVPIRKLN